MRGKLFLLFILIAVGAYYYIDSKEIVVNKGLILMTGCSSGIGKKTAFHMAENGFHVLASVRNEKDQSDLRKEVKERGYENLIIPFILDVTKDDQVQNSVILVEKFLKEHKGLKFISLVNNAGISSRMPAEHLDLEHTKFLYDVNLFGVMRMSKAFIPLLRKTERSSIIQISSLLGRVTLPYSGVYCSSKFALESYTDALRAEVASFGIRVVSVQPGYFKTEIVSKSKKKMSETYSFETSPQVKKDYPKFNYFEKTDDDRPDSFPVSETILEAIRVKRPWPVYTVGYFDKVQAILASALPNILTSLVRLRFV